MRRESDRIGWDRGKGWPGNCMHGVSCHVVQCLPFSTRWQWGTVAMETIQSDYHCTQGLFSYFHLPSDITPFSSCSAESRMSACRVDQWGSMAGLCSAQTDRLRQGLMHRREEGKKPMWSWLNEMMLGSKSMRNLVREVVLIISY